MLTPGTVPASFHECWCVLSPPRTVSHSVLVPARCVSLRITVLIFKMKKRSLEEAGEPPRPRPASGGWGFKPTHALRAGLECQGQEEAVPPGRQAHLLGGGRLSTMLPRDGCLQPRTNASPRSRNQVYGRSFHITSLQVNNRFSRRLSPCYGICAFAAWERSKSGYI